MSFAFHTIRKSIFLYIKRNRRTRIINLPYPSQQKKQNKKKKKQDSELKFNAAVTEIHLVY